MKLLVDKEELNYLIKKKMVAPRKDNVMQFQVKLVSFSGESYKMDIDVDTETTLLESTKPLEIKQQELELVAKPKKKSNGHSNVVLWIDDWRKAWARKKVGAMGSRDNAIKNMKEFFQLYPEFTKEDVYAARDKYLATFLSDMTYLERADYFIKKSIISKEDGKRTIRRTLLNYCEEVRIDKELGTEGTFSIYDDV